MVPNKKLSKQVHDKVSAWFASICTVSHASRVWFTVIKYPHLLLRWAVVCTRLLVYNQSGFTARMGLGFGAVKAETKINKNYPFIGRLYQDNFLGGLFYDSPTRYINTVAIVRKDTRVINKRHTKLPNTVLYYSTILFYLALIHPFLCYDRDPPPTAGICGALHHSKTAGRELRIHGR